ncbi:MAG: TIGR04376 family protein [Microcoleaceae cyanobacterium]
MGLFDDFSRFLETRLEEFLKDNPHLELQALEEQLREQETDTLRLIADLQRQEKRLQDEILSIAQDIQRWHERVAKAKAANRPDLAQAAEEREAALLRQGNQRWGQMQGVKERIEQSKQLYKQVKQRRQEVKVKAQEAEAARTQNRAQTQSSWDIPDWKQTANYNSFGSAGDPLEQQFKSWEAEADLDELKRQMGK